MKKLILVLALVLSLALVGCNNAPKTMEETDQNKMQSIPADKADDIKTTETTEAPAAQETMKTVSVSAQEAVDVFNENHKDVQVDEISLNKDNGIYYYEINGFDATTEFEMKINASDKSIIEDKSEMDNTADKKALDLNLIKNIDELVASSLSEAGEGYHLDSFSLEYETVGNFTKLDVELEDASGKDIEYEYNLETKELIKKDR